MQHKLLLPLHYKTTLECIVSLSGMTGTAITEAGEFWEIYKLDVVEIPTNRPIQRDDKEDLVYKTTREKYNAVIDDVVELVNKDVLF